jgi:hypothetical protein
MTTTTFISLHMLANVPNKRTISVVKHTEHPESGQQHCSVFPSGEGGAPWYFGLFQFPSSSDGSPS